MQEIMGVFEHVTIKDLIDILLVSAIIYRNMTIIRGTRAVQMLAGLFTMVVMYWSSHKYQLYSVNWILDHFFEYFIVIFIILFQDQIRGALSTLGYGRLFGNKAGDTDLSTTVEEVVEVCGVLSRERIGALIVFERSQGLQDYQETGTRLNCEIHSDILYSLFQTSSPLHDGAVMIAQGKIAAAGCFLPLSKNVEIDRHLGTRHRAALGITEVSDAVVVIVSEETGNFKVCFNGVFYHMRDEAILRRQLMHLLSTNEVTNLASELDDVKDLG